MSRIIISGIQSAVRSFISSSIRQIRYIMAGASSRYETEVCDDVDKDDLDIVSHPGEVISDNKLLNGDSVNVSETSDVVNIESPIPKWQFDVSSSSRVFLSDREKDYSLRGMLFAHEQPKRQLRISLRSNSEKVYGTCQQNIRDEKGQQDKMLLKFTQFSVLWISSTAFYLVFSSLFLV